MFVHPSGLTLLRHFTVPDTQTWGSNRDEEFKAFLVEASGMGSGDGGQFEWFAFSIRVYVERNLIRRQKQKPDIENFPKLVVDAFTGVLYPDDHLDRVRGVQVEGAWVDDDEERTEVWIWGMPVE